MQPASHRDVTLVNMHESTSHREKRMHMASQSQDMHSRETKRGNNWHFHRSREFCAEIIALRMIGAHGHTTI